MDFRSRVSKSIRGSSSSTRRKIGKKCPPFGLTVQADLCLRRNEEYLGTPRSCGGTNPSSTANALRKDLRRAYLGAMHALYEKNTSAKEIVEAGVKAAAEFDDGCALPVKTRVLKIKK